MLCRGASPPAPPGPAGGMALVLVLVGQCGNQVGAEFWRRVALARAAAAASDRWLDAIFNQTRGVAGEEDALQPRRVPQTLNRVLNPKILTLSLTLNPKTLNLSLNPKP